MNVWMISPEMAPFIKVGGLGDVVGALPKALGALGLDVTVFVPFVRGVNPSGCEIRDLGMTVDVKETGGTVTARLLETRIPGSRVKTVFIDCPKYFDRDGVYGTPKGEFPDNAIRFAFFCRAALLAGRRTSPGPDIIHAHDWAAALALFYARAPEHYGLSSDIGRARLVMSIHNMAHQGRFPKQIVPELGIDWSRFNHIELEYWDMINFLKAGIVFSDAIATVSPTYAREIQLPENGFGLDGVLGERAYRLHGILNGIDYASYDPKTDPALIRNFGPKDLSVREENKEGLQRLMGLDDGDEPVIGMVARFVEQKGVEILLGLMDRMEGLGIKWALLGAGEERYENALIEAAKRFPGKVGLKVGFSEDLARKIYAGSDFFFMPSVFEPCGLSQMIAYRYGSIPIVRATGGLIDTVEDFESGGAGVLFTHPTVDEADHALRRALNLYGDRKGLADLRKTGMGFDYSWKASAGKYADLYGML